MKRKYAYLLYLVISIINSAVLVKAGCNAKNLEWWISMLCVCSSFLIGFEFGYAPFQKVLDIIREYESKMPKNH